MMITPSDLAVAKQVLLRRARLLVEQHGVPDLMLSGGVDSATILFALLDQGIKPRCITFQLGDYVSPDVAVASAICAHFGVEHEIVRVPRDPDLLIDDVTWTLRAVRWEVAPRIKKTIVQCVHPMRHAYPVAGRFVLFGLTGDQFFRTSAQEIRNDHRYGWAAMSHNRQSDCHQPEYSDFHIMDVGRRLFTRTVEDFYDFDAWGAWIQQFPTPVTNRPIQKYPVVAAFEEYWRQGRWYRPNSPYQINSGLREYHDTLLTHPRFADLGAKGVIAVYNKLAADLGIAAGAAYTPSRLKPALRWADYKDEWLA
jgi:hypothetical protein